LNRLAAFTDALVAEMKELVAPTQLWSAQREFGEAARDTQERDGPPVLTPSLLYGMLRYHLGWADETFEPVVTDAGKRVRPLILLLVTEAQGGDWRQATPAAAAIELLHNFTLIHDDIEDRDEVRRGRPTLWKLWGVAQALNAGDALFALSYRGLTKLRVRGVPAERVALALERFTEAIVAITEGQCWDLAFEAQSEVEEAVYLSMIHGKTATLLGLSAELGGHIAGASPTRTSALRSYGEALGMAFQMHDDILGLWGDPVRTGKPVGSDLLMGKKTLPILHGLRLNVALRGLLAQESLTDADIRSALLELERSGSRAYTEAQASLYHARAIEVLEQSGGTGEAQEALRALTENLLSRDR
jgi:geranylgeranyl diphosphate synthase, type I